MCNRHHPPNKPHPAKPKPIKRQYHPPQQTEQKHDFDEESESDLHLFSLHYVKNGKFIIEAVVLGIIILLIAAASSTFIAALYIILLIVHIGGTRALEIVPRVLKALKNH